jgi:hypothetical protein
LEVNCRHSFAWAVKDRADASAKAKSLRIYNSILESIGCFRRFPKRSISSGLMAT